MRSTIFASFFTPAGAARTGARRHRWWRAFLLAAAFGPIAFAANPKISIGGSHTLMVAGDGMVWAWGNNANGQLGNGSQLNRSVMVPLPGLGAVTAVAAGAIHSLALKGDGTVWQWGYDPCVQWSDDPGDEEDGHWDGINRPSPVQVMVSASQPLTNVIAVAAGSNYSLALRSNGEVYRWGNGAYAPNGWYNSSGSSFAQPVWSGNGLSGITSIVAGPSHALALKNDGTVLIWSATSATPSPVNGLTQVVEIAAGDGFSLARKSDGTVRAWGTNSAGQLGDGTTTMRATPVQVSNLTGVTAIAAGGATSLALRGDGSVWSWGANTSGQLGDGTTINRLAPTQITAAAGAVAIGTGGNHSAAVKGDGSIQAWGQNTQGQVGDGTVTQRLMPITVYAANNNPGFATSAGGGHSLMVAGDGTVWAWGNNNCGQLGNNSTLSRSNPVKVSGLTNVKAVAAGRQHSLALKNDGTVWYWGYDPCYHFNEDPEDSYYSYWDGINRPVPVQVSGLTNVVALAAGNNFSIALRSDGSIWTWGDAADGRLGRSPGTNQNVPQGISGGVVFTAIAAGDKYGLAARFDGSVLTWGNGADPVSVGGLDSVVGVAAGSGFSLALKNDGTVRAWGNNQYGQLGDGTTTNRTSPVTVTGLSAVVSLSAGEASSAARKSDGSIWTWGYNASGQLGDGTTTNRSTATSVSGLTAVAAIAMGGNHSIVTKADGSALTWGQNAQGQLGDSTMTQRTSATGVSGLPPPAVPPMPVATGAGHNLVLTSDGKIWAWGNNSNYQLGDGTTINRTSLVQVSGLTSVKAVAAGTRHSLALKSDGTVWQWGWDPCDHWNEDPEAEWGGTWSGANRPAPVRVDVGYNSPLTNVVAIAAGNDFSIALRGDGTVYTWGEASNFRLGRSGSPGAKWAQTIEGGGGSVVMIAAGNTHGLALRGDGTVLTWGAGVESVSFVSGLSQIVGIAAGNGFSLALKNDGTVQSWGTNQYGQLGDGSTTNRTSPVTVTGLSAVIAISAGNATGLARRADGTIWTWGYNANGQVGDGSTANRLAPVQLPGLTAVSAALGANHGLVIRSDGSAVTWGLNSQGQLGDNTNTQRTSPVVVSGGPFSGATSLPLVAGGSHTLMITADGKVWAWGNNANGQLGDGTLLNRANPVQVSGLTGVVAVAAGNSHSLALKSDGTVWQWGWDPCYQWSADAEAENGGTWTGISRFVPVPVSGLAGVVAVAAGNNFSVALKSNGTVMVWGEGGQGQLGQGGTASSPAPSQPWSLSGIIAIAAGTTHALALKNDGTVMSWGAGVLSPTAVGGLAQIVSLAAGANFSLALKNDGTVLAWGGNQSGQLGDGTTTDRTTPVPVIGLTDIVSVSAGGASGLARKSDGTVWAWGQNANAQLGDGSTTNRPTAVQVSGVTGGVGIAMGGGHAVVVKSDGTRLGWGRNTQGQIGDGSSVQRSTAVAIGAVPPPVPVVIPVSAGGSHTLFAAGDGRVWAWGNNANGQLGDGTTASRAMAMPVVGLTNVTTVIAGTRHSLALKSDGTVWQWGYDPCGNFNDDDGDWEGTTNVTPVQVKVSATVALTNVIAIAAGNDFSLALRSNGAVVSWGDMTGGRLGRIGGQDAKWALPIDGGITGVIAIAAGNAHGLALKNDGTVVAWGGTVTSPATVSGLSQIIGIAAGNGFSLALKFDGSVLGWGNNASGQLGDGTTTNRTTPVAVTGFNGVVALSAAGSTSLARKSDGTVWAWGSNANGQLGDGTTTNRSTPVQVSALTGVVTASLGGSHAIAAKADGTSKAWGLNAQGQLGDNTLTQRTTAVAVLPPDTSAPAAPSNLQAGSEITDSSVPLSWTAATDNVGITGYEVFYDSTSLGFVTATTTTVTGLNSNTSYQFKVRARDAVGNLSAFSTAVPARTAESDPEEPSPAATRTDYDVTVTGTNAGAIWGTDVYTDDSTIAMAAVHAGRINAGETAQIHVHYSAGQPNYAGSVAHGVSSMSWGAWPYSISFPAPGSGGSGGGSGGNVAPQVVTPPPAVTTVTLGSTMTIGVTASGSDPKTYQWRKNGIAFSDGGRIKGATWAAVTISNVQAGDEGVYSAVVVNNSGSATSAGSQVVVDEPPVVGTVAIPASPSNTSIPIAVAASDADGVGGGKGLAKIQIYVSEPPSYNGFYLKGTVDFVNQQTNQNISDLVINGTTGAATFTWHPSSPLAGGVYQVWVRAYDAKDAIDSNGGTISSFAIGSAAARTINVQPYEFAAGMDLTISYSGAPDPAWVGVYRYIDLDSATPLFWAQIGAGGGVIAPVPTNTTYAVGQVFNARLFGTSNPTAGQALAVSNTTVAVQRWGLTVVNGTGGGSYLPSNTPLGIHADAPSGGQAFIGWTLSGPGATIVDASQPNTTVTLGSGNATVRANFTGLPQITSGLTATVPAGASFSYTIAATNNPTSFSAVNLPSGLTLNPATGVISGAPTSYGIFSISIGAGNAGGFGYATLTLTISGATPVPVAQAVSNLSASTFTANWSAISGATGYRIDVASDGGFSSTSVNNQFVAPSSNSFFVDQRLSNTTYYYRVRSENAGGTSANSNVVAATTLPVIATPPSSQSAVAGQASAVSFAVVVPGTAALTYQWKRNGVSLANGSVNSGLAATVAGATTATLTLTGIQASDGGTYTVVVTNAGGSVTSPGAVLGLGGIDLVIHRP